MSRSSNSDDYPNSSYNQSSDENNNSPIDDNNELINIYLRVKKTINNVQVRKTDQIKSLKLHGISEGVSGNLQELYHGDQFLEEDLTLADYNIKQNSTIKVEFTINSIFAKTFFIKIPSSNSDNAIKVHAREDDTIDIVKSMVLIKERLKSDDFDLMFNGKFLSVNETILSANIVNESLLFLVQNPEDTISIQVSIYAKETLAIEVKKLLTVGDLKLLIASMTNSESENSVMYFAGKLLKDARTITSYDIDEQDMVEFVAQFPVDVKMSNGDVVSIKVYPADNVKDVIFKLSRKVMLLSEHPALFFNGARLEGNRAIAHYNVVEGSILSIGEAGN